MELKNIFGFDQYAGYLWSCVLLTAVVLIGNAWLARRSLAQAQAKARRRTEGQRSET